MKKSYMTILLLIMVMILGISAVSAADMDDASDSDLLSVEEEAIDEIATSDVEDVVTASDDTEVLAEDGEGNFTDLQKTIDSRDMVVMDKDYTRVEEESDISISKDVTILGNSHIIDANNLGGIFNVNSGCTLTLIGVTLINGNAENGGAIYNNGGLLTIIDSYLLNNTAAKSGGAVYNNGGSVTVSGSTLDGNDLTDRTHNGWGGAAIYDNAGTVLISTSTISNNLKDIVHRGGTGAYTGDLSSAAVTSENGELTVSDSSFENNSGSYGGAILSKGADAVLAVSGSTFTNNFAFNGGAIDFAGNTYTITTSTFKGNKARGSGSSNTNYANGGAICAQETNGDSIISDCIFEDNSAVMGGAISSTNTHVIGCTFTNNTAQAAYSENFNGKVNNRGGFGGAIISTETITIENSDFTDNIGRSRGLDLKNADITESSFTNTIINVNNKGVVSVSDNTYDNVDKDIGSTTNCYVNIGEGEVPKVTGGIVNYDATSFTDLQAIVDSGTTASIYLTSDITKLASEEETFANGVIIDRAVSIHVQGHTITSNNGKVFNVAEGATLSLYDANVVGDGTSAIVNNGQVSLIVANPCTFTNVGEYAIENNGRVSESSLTTFTQLNDLIGLVNGGEVYIGSSKITKAADEKETFKDGIVIENDITLVGFYSTYYKRIDTQIDADNDGRIFSVNDGATLTLDTIVLKNGNAEKGGAVYVEAASALIANKVNFIDNTAVYRGGAIYSEGAVAVDNSLFDGNDITFRTKNDDNGGAAIYNLNGELTIKNTDITNNLKDIVVRNGNAGDLLVGVVVTSGETLIENSYFANNTGSWGGAISSLGYLNDDSYTVTVKNSKFEGNNATFGGAIFVESSNLIVENSTFENNKGVGVGSSGTSNTQGGAIVVFPDGASAQITDSTFIANSANTGGAVSFAGVDSDSIIENCTFTDNTANDGGAVYLWTSGDAAVTVANSTFSGNTAGWGNAISTDGKLALSNNTISETSADIGNWGGSIISTLYVVVMNNGTYSYHMADIALNATVTDDNGNLIRDKNIVFTIGDIANVTATYADGIYTATYAPTVAGTYVVSVGEEGADGFIVQTSTITISKSLTDLAKLINDDTTGTITLDGDYTYIAEFDEGLENGIVIDKNIIIDGNGSIISGSDVARLFNVAANVELTLKNVTLRDAKADKGAAVYVAKDGLFDADAVNFINNTATYRGGAIYSEGTVNIVDSVFDSNDITFRTKNDDNGGAAIYNNNGVLSIVGSNITNNLKDIVVRNGNAGDLLVGVVVTSGETLIENSYFANNTGSWGGAISSLGYLNDDSYTLVIKDSKFEGNNATFGGAIFVESSNLIVENSTFENNKGVGVGSSGTSNTQGGAIVVFPDGASAQITDSTFIANSANTGGAVSFAGVDSDSIIENCTFTDNTANDGGAVYLWTSGDAAVTVANSTFSGNTAGWGNAISTDGKLALFNNTISETSADIGNWGGEIISTINVVILNNETVDVNAETLITATVTDDNGNLIKDVNFGFMVNETAVDAVFNATSGLYQGIYKNNNAIGVYIVNITYSSEEKLVVKTATLRNIKGTFTDLQNIIDNDEIGLITLPYDFAYSETIDGDKFVNGVVIDDKSLYIIGNDSTIDGGNSARIFNIVNGSILMLDDATLTNGIADYGGAIYVDADSFLNTENVIFTNNTATYRGGAIYSEGTVNIADSVFDSNDITFRTKNDDNGGAAIYNYNGALTIKDSNITNNLKDIVIRNGNAGDLLVGAVVTSGYTEITGSYFANNTGSWGGAISSLGYLNDDSYTVTVKNSKFEGNNATFGGAIFVESSNLEVENSTFENNKGVGVGSSGTSNTQGGAIVVFPGEAYAQIIDSTFIANSANVGGAVSLAGIGSDSLIENCTFTDNTASDGGAVYLWTSDDAVVTVANSTFSGNTAGWGNAISTDGTLKLSNNTISSTNADIGNWGGSIISTINVEIMDNGTYSYHMSDIALNATITDDNGNLIKDINFNFTIGETDEVVANIVDSMYVGVYTPTAPGTYVVNISYVNDDNLVVKTATITISKSLIDLANIIANADEDDTIVLDGDYSYIAEFDSEIVNGIVIDKNIVIDGNGSIISGSDVARLFNVAAGVEFTLKNATLMDAKADKGAAVYVAKDALFDAEAVNFINNTATYRGGAIYSEGTVNIADSVFDSNDITFRTKNDDNGGAAIYNNNGVLSIVGSNITNNLKDIVIRNGNAGDLLVGVVVTSGETIIKDSYFANNTGSWGGAISSLGYMNDEEYTLTVLDSKFEGNNATFGGAIFVESSNLIVENSTFENNKGVGVGSSGTSNTQGGAIVVFPDGASAQITDSTFIANSANTGGAVSFAGVDSDSIIENCTFTDNTANDGGAIYLWTSDDAVVTVANSTFSGNTAGWGSAISTDGKLALSNNTISSNVAEIGNWAGEISSLIVATFLDNKTVNDAGLGDIYLLYATLTDDNGNNIIDHNFKFTVNGVELYDNPIYDKDAGLYKLAYSIEKAGTFEISTSLEGDNLEIYTGIIEIELANVTEFTVTVNDILDGDNATVFVTLIGVNQTGLTADIKVILNNTEYTIHVVEGNGNTTIEGLAHGQYPVVAMFNGDSNYNSAINSTVFYVKGQAKLNIIELTTAEYGDEISITINLTDSEGNLLSGVVVINDTIKVLVEDGIGTFVIDNQPDVGNYYFQADYEGNDDYFGCLADFNVTVEVKEIDQSEIEYYFDGDYDDGLNITIKSPVDGSYTVDINGTKVTVEVVNGTGSAIAKLEKPDDYTAVITIDDDNYSLEPIEYDLIYKGAPEYSVEISGTYPNAEIRILGTPGTYHVDVEGFDIINITVAEYGMSGVATIENIDAGNYAAIVSFDANDGYHGDYKDVDFTVAKAASSVTIDPIENVVYGNPIVIYYNINNRTDFVTISISNVKTPDVSEEFVYGENNLTANLPAGTYIVKIHNGENENYNESEQESEFTVAKAETITISVEGEIGVMGAGTVNITVANDATGYIIVDNNGVKDAYELVNGSYSFEINNLQAGEYTISVKYLGDDNYNKTEDSKVLNIPKLAVDPAITDLIGEISCGEDATFTVTMPNNFASGNVTVYVDGIENQVVVLDSDYANASVIIKGLTNGTHTIGVKYNGNDNYNASDIVTADVVVNVKAIDPEDVKIEIDNINEFGEGINVTITSPVDGTYAVNINGTVANVEVINGVGSATVKPENPGIFNATVTIVKDGYSYENTTDYFEYLVTPEFNVSISGTYPNAEISITGPAGTYHVIIDGRETIDVVCEESGIPAVYTIEGIDAGNYTATVSFDSHDEYYGGANDVNFTVAKAELTIEEPEVIGDKLVDSKINITFKLPTDVNASNIVAFIDGFPVVELSVNETTGVYTLELDGFSTESSHLFTVEVNDPNYEKSYAEVSFYINKINPTLDVNDVTADWNAPVDIPIKLTGADGTPIVGDVIVTVSWDADALTQIVKLDENGEGNASFVITDALGDLTITATFYGNDKYNATVKTATLTIAEPKEAKLIVVADSQVPYNDVAYVNVTLTNVRDVPIANANVNYVIDDGEVQSIKVDENGYVSIPITGLAGGKHTIQVSFNNESYTTQPTESVTVTVTSLEPTFTSEVTQDAKVGDNVTIEIKAPVDATGNVTVVVDGEIVNPALPINKGVASINVTGLGSGHHSYVVIYNGDDNYEIASDMNSFDVSKVTPEITISDIEGAVGETVSANVAIAGGDAIGYVLFNNVAYEVKDGKSTIQVGISEAGIQTITVTYLGDDKYANGTANKEFDASKATTAINLADSEITTVVGRDVEVKYTIDPSVSEGNLTVKINGEVCYNDEIAKFDGNILISADKLPTNGTYTVEVQYIGTTKYMDSNVETLVINVTKANVEININVPANTTTPVFNITVPKDAGGLLLVDIDGKHYYAEVENGTASITVPGLEPGNYTANITYTGDDFYDGATETTTVTVPANADENCITLPEGATTTNPTFSIDLPSDATGYFEVDVDGKKYVVPVENGTASISVPGLSAGDHNVIVKYSGDSKYNSISKSTTLKLKEPVAKLSKNKYIKVIYSAKATYKVLLTLDGKAAAGKVVTIKFNGKTYNVKTDSKGYATLKLNTKVKPKKYTVTATYKGVKVTSKVKVKHVIKAKNKKAKKSKKLKIKVKLKKVDGKVLKNKKVTLKFKGKKYTAKTNKKGKAKFTIKKKVMKKLKKGKKYKYKVFYGKDKVTKKIKVKK